MNRLFSSRTRAVRSVGACLLALAFGACAQPAAPTPPSTAAPATPSLDRPIVIAHRGASGYLPEHTLAAYWLAIEQGADYVEPDLVPTKDGVLVARHENAIAIVGADGLVKEATTDVADHPRFADRQRTKTIDGTAITGWFTEDFTLAELKTLRARERLPKLRTANTRFDGMFEVPTFDEILQLVAQVNTQRRAKAAREGTAPRLVGVYPETKHPTYFAGIGLPIEEPLLRALQAHGLAGREAPVVIQSFEVANLKKLRGLTAVRLVQLVSPSRQPHDFAAAGDRRTYRDLVQPDGLREIATYADGIGAHTSLLIPLAGGRLGTPTSLVREAHAAGLRVHAWTLRAENQFLPDDFDRGRDAGGLGDLAGQAQALLALGIDGFFTDHAFLGVQARDAFLARSR